MIGGAYSYVWNRVDQNFTSSPLSFSGSINSVHMYIIIRESNQHRPFFEALVACFFAF
jgi:hypothetical protein